MIIEVMDPRALLSAYDNQLRSDAETTGAVSVSRWARCAWSRSQVGAAS
jgi:hypothetical protein